MASNKIQLQDKASVIISASIIIPLVLSSILGYFLLKYVNVQKDTKIMMSFVKAKESKLLKAQNRYVQAMDSIIADKNKLSQYQKDVKTNLADYLFISNHKLASNSDEIQEYKDEFLEIQNNQKSKTISGYYIFNNKFYLMTVKKISKNKTYFFLWNFSEKADGNGNLLGDYRFSIIPISSNSIRNSLNNSTNYFYSKNIFFSKEQKITVFQKLNGINHNLIGVLQITHFSDISLPLKATLFIIILILVTIYILLALVIAKKLANYIFTPIEKLNEHLSSVIKNPFRNKILPEKKYSMIAPIVNSFNQVLKSVNNYYQSVKQYEKIVEDISEAFFVADTNKKVVFRNKIFVDIFDNQENQFFDNLLQIKDTEDFNNFNKELTLGSKTYIVKIKSFSDNYFSYLGIMTDITLQKKEEDEKLAIKMRLSRVEKLAEIGLYVEGIIHNLNSPLNNLMGYIQLLKANLSHNKDVDKIYENGKRMTELIKSLKHKTSNQVLFIPRKINVNQLIESEINFLKHNLYFKTKIKPVLKLNSDLPEVILIYSDLNQAISNIINNAIESMNDSEERVLTIQTYEENSEIIIEIEDTGKGISDEDLTKIFNLFYSTKPQKASSRGLGLSISQKLIESFDGFITAESELNKGSKFFIHIPLHYEALYEI